MRRRRGGAARAAGGLCPSCWRRSVTTSSWVRRHSPLFSPSSAPRPYLRRPDEPPSRASAALLPALSTPLHHHLRDHQRAAPPPLRPVARPPLSCFTRPPPSSSYRAVCAAWPPPRPPRSAAHQTMLQSKRTCFPFGAGIPLSCGRNHTHETRLSSGSRPGVLLRVHFSCLRRGKPALTCRIH